MSVIEKIKSLLGMGGKKDGQDDQMKKDQEQAKMASSIQEAGQNDDSDKEDEEKVKDRLKSLGYL